MAARADIDALTVVSEAVVLRSEAAKVASARKALKIVIEDSDVVALGDPIRVRQIIRCLVSKAARYGGERVEFRFRRDGDRAKLTVADSGTGVTAGHERHIFDAFHRAGTSDVTTKAIGLGLYVSHHLAGLMGGDLIYRRSGGWTLFELDLPYVSGQAVSHPAAPHLDPGVSAPTPATDGPLVQPV